MNQKGFANVAVIIAAVILVGVIGYFALNRKAPSPAPVATQPSFSEQIQSFESMGKSGYSGLEDRKDYVIKDASEWKNLWEVAYARVSQKPALPVVDFNNEMIIAVAQGSHSTGGYNIEVTGILEKENSLEVQVKETSPAPGAIVTQAFTQPFHIVKTKKSDKEVVFKR